MNIAVSGKQTRVGQSLTNYVKEVISNSLKKYFNDFISADIHFSKDTFNFKCEINIHINSSIYIQSNGLSNDAYGSFNIANEKIKKRVRRYHRKLTDHKNRITSKIKELSANQYVLKNPDIVKSKPKETEIENPVIIAETEVLIKTLSVSEALMIMSLTDQNAIMFKNTMNKRLNMLYKRSDGNISCVDPIKN